MRTQLLQNKMELKLEWIWLIVVWGANLTDLIKGVHWMYNSIEAIIFWNIMGILSLVLILTNRGSSS